VRPEDLISHITTRGIASETVSYYDRGQTRAQNSPLVLIHGMFGDYLDWEPVLEPLSTTHRAIAPDLPGFGDSSKPQREYTAEFFIAILHELFRELKLERPILVGNSFGGQIAMLYAIAHPDVISKLVLVNSGGFREYTAEERSQIEPRFSEPVLASLTPQINALLFAGVFTKQSETSVRYLAKQDAKLQRPDYPAYAHALASSIRLSLASYLIDRLPEIHCPTLLVWGENDQVLPVEQARLALGRLPRAELKTIPNCGHVPQLECPQGFLVATHQFFSHR
jgi:pimeloyl-ACP methyl ester carboxylesterase